jgi:hypothetical protein
MNIIIIRETRQLPDGLTRYADVHNGAAYTPDELAQAFRERFHAEPPATAYRFETCNNVLIPMVMP